MAQKTPLGDLLSRLDSVLSEHERVHKQAVALIPASFRIQTQREMDGRSRARKQSASKPPSGSPRPKRPASASVNPWTP